MLLITDIHISSIKADGFCFNGKEIYLYGPDGYGRTKFFNNFFEKNLKVSATTRNWNTVNKLYAIAEALDSI